jgi:hypothetical protein
MSTYLILDAAIRAENRYQAKLIIEKAIKTLGFVEEHEIVYGKKIEFYVPMAYAQRKYLFNKKEKVFSAASKDGFVQKVEISNAPEWYKEIKKEKQQSIKERLSLVERNYVLWKTEIVEDRLTDHLVYKPTGAKFPFYNMMENDGDLEKLVKFKAEEDKKLHAK